MTRYLAILLVCCALLAQKPAKQPESSVPSCGRGENPSHRCNCMQSWSDAQNEYMQKCQGKDESVKKLIACLRDMPENLKDHCLYAESHGNWHMNDKGEHDQSMPGQCSRACTRADCRCAQGAQHDGGDRPDKKESKTVCHYMQYSGDDIP